MRLYVELYRDMGICQRACFEKHFGEALRLKGAGKTIEMSVCFRV